MIMVCAWNKKLIDNERVSNRAIRIRGNLKCHNIDNRELINFIIMKYDGASERKTSRQ